MTCDREFNVLSQDLYNTKLKSSAACVANKIHFWKRYCSTLVVVRKANRKPSVERVASEDAVKESPHSTDGTGPGMNLRQLPAILNYYTHKLFWPILTFIAV